MEAEYRRLIFGVVSKKRKGTSSRWTLDLNTDLGDRTRGPELSCDGAIRQQNNNTRDGSASPHVI